MHCCHLEMRIVVDPPLGSQYSDDIASARQHTLVEHDPMNRGDNRGVSFRKDINAFVHSGGTPRLIPEGLVVPVPCRGTLDWDNHTLR